MSGWTKTVRPPVSYTNKIKRQEMRVAGVTKSTDYELDHVVPLELGGLRGIRKTCTSRHGSGRTGRKRRMRSKAR